MAAVTNDQKLDALKQQEFILLQFEKLEVFHEGVSRAVPAPEALRKGLFLPLPASGGCQQSSAGGCIAPASASASVVP